MRQETITSPEEKLSSGQWLWKTLRPAGCLLVLAMMVAAIVICFTYGADPIPGYEPPRSMAEYAEDPAALCQELEEHVLPALDGEAQVLVEEDHVVVIPSPDSYAVIRSGVLRYFDPSLLEFRQSG